MIPTTSFELSLKLVTAGVDGSGTYLIVLESEGK